MSIDLDSVINQQAAHDRSNGPAGGEPGRRPFRDDLTPGLLERARAIRPLLEANAAEHERRGELTHEVVEALDEIGIFRMAAPERVGGLRQSCRALTEVAVELAKGCPSTSWVYTILASILWFASKMPEALQAEVFADRVPRFCSPQSGGGRLVRDGDGYRLSGRWGYGTGSHHSDFAIVPAKTEADEITMVVIRLDEASIEPTWNVMGMKATGSDTVVVEDLKIQASRLFPSSALYIFPTPGVDDAALEAPDYFVTTPLLRAKSLGVLLGCAEGILEAVIEKRRSPIAYSNYLHKDDSAAYHYLVGRAATQIRSARDLIEIECDRIDAAASSGTVLSADARMHMRAQGSLVVDILSEAVTRLLDVGGSSLFLAPGKAERYWRDFSVAARHVVYNPQLNFEAVGRDVLSITPNVIEPFIV